MSIVLVIYVLISAGMLVYAANCYVLLALFLRRRRSAEAASTRVIAGARPAFASARTLPVVTTQIPIYNEANVAERALRAAAAIDYPRDRHEIQVLDDSTDETRRIIDRVAAELRGRGHWVEVVRRTQRDGFKAGALAQGMTCAAGEFFAIFDADFVPPPHFLRHTLPFFLGHERLGLVQARWGHLNATDSILTRAQAIGIDGHFMVEQSARTFNGLLMNFNGTAGIWRRQAIDDAGGWSADTLTEDLDLSYRAQLAGWATHFVASLEAPAELPTTVAAFKSQQFRWAKGSIQTSRKLLPRIWADRGLSAWVKLQATLHLTHYGIHPLMLVAAVLALPMMLAAPESSPAGARVVLAGAMLVSFLAPNALYIASQRALYRNWWRRVCWLPALSCIGVGLALSNSRAVLEGMFGHTPSEFIRTPKRGAAAAKRYRVRTPLPPWLELAMGGYCAASLLVYLGLGNFAGGPFLLIYAAGFLLIGGIGLRELTPARGVAAC